MDPTPTATAAAALKTLGNKSSTTINGTLKKHHHPPPPQSSPPSLFRECLKNHAASLGGHALDGCGEFMPSGPSSLSCAACGCHRNFHRRIHLQNFHPNFHDNADASSENAADQGEEEDGMKRQGQQYSSSPPPPSAPHMLLALSTGGMSAGPTSSGPRKRFRTKFSPEQKEKMLELCEILGWRMQKRDEGIIEERCREIGVGKGVFKIWMHNNKHHFRKSAAAGVAGGGNGQSAGAGFHGSASSSS